MYIIIVHSTLPPSLTPSHLIPTSLTHSHLTHTGIKFDLAVDVMMVARGFGIGMGKNDAKMPVNISNDNVLHFILKGKPELNIELSEILDRDTVLCGFMQCISR
jgi:hypothetical protein